MPAGSSGHANSIEGSIIKNHDLLIFKTVIGLHLLKLRWKRLLMMM
jgi:hypothetical protein